MEKYIKFSLITLFLISSFKYTNTEACTKTGITENECKANTTCEWTAPTSACKGVSACEATANQANQATCTATTTGCTYATGTPATCKDSDDNACDIEFSDADTCQKCHWVTTEGKCSVKSSNPDGDPDEDFGSCLKFSSLIGLLSLLF